MSELAGLKPDQARELAYPNILLPDENPDGEQSESHPGLSPGSTVNFDMFVDHVEGQAERLFEMVRERDLEGIVCKHRLSRYVVEDSNPAWVKIKNRSTRRSSDVTNFLSASGRQPGRRRLARMFATAPVRLQQSNY